jgi:hypothetical protein
MTGCKVAPLFVLLGLFLAQPVFADLAASAPTSPPDLPLDRLGWVTGAALVIHRLLQLLKNPKIPYPDKWRPYLPLVAAVLGVGAAVLDAVVNGTPWYLALLTGVLGATGAVFVRETGRAVAHARKKPDPPPAGKDMGDDDLADAVSEG